MKEKFVKARVKAYTISAAKCFTENGEIFTEDLPDYTTTAKVTDSNAAKIYKINSGANINPGEVLLIKSVNYAEKVYEMPLAKFMETAEIEPDESGENGEEMES